MNRSAEFLRKFQPLTTLPFVVIVVIVGGLMASPSAATLVIQPVGRQDDGYNKHVYGHTGVTTYDLYAPWASYALVQVVAAGPGETAIGGAIMHFPLAGAPQEIVSATLRFYGDLPYPLVVVDHLDALVGSDVELWEIETPQTRAFRFFGPEPGRIVQWFDADVTALVQQDISLGRGYSAFNFTGLAGQVWLSESGALGPSLTIVPVPEPSGLAVLLLGLGGYTGWRSKWRWKR